MAMDETSANSPVLLREDTGGIATLTLNRPNKYNALSVELLTSLENTLEAIASDDTVRVVVLTAAGKAFCAGHDLSEIREDTTLETTKALFDQCSRVMLAITRIPQPVIARVHGTATAAGCQLVATCDLAIAAEEARFATSGVNLGLFCATPLVAVTRNLGRKQAMEMLMTGDFIDAQTAQEWGLVNRVVAASELDAAVAALASKIASKLPAAVAAGKRLFYRQMEAATEAAYKDAGQVITANMMDEDAQEGIDAFLAKRPLPDRTPE